MHRHRALDGDAAKLVGLALGGTHVWPGCSGEWWRTLGERLRGFNRKSALALGRCSAWHARNHGSGCQP